MGLTTLLSGVAVLIFFRKVPLRCCDGLGIGLFIRTMVSEKKILSAGPPALPQTLNISIVIVVGVIHQGGSRVGGGGEALLSFFHVCLSLSSQVEITPVS